MRIHPALVTGALCVMLLSSSCGGKPAHPNAAPTTIAPPAVTQPVDPFAVPATIDIAYVTKVLNELEHIRGDVRRDVHETKTFSPHTQTRLKDIYQGKLLDAQLQLWSDSSMHDHPEAKAVPGDERMTVQNIRSDSPGCISLQAEDDTDDVLKQTLPPSGPWVIVLFTADTPTSQNKTNWRMVYDDLAGNKGSDYKCK